jgi:hypothetical protein
MVVRLVQSCLKIIQLSMEEQAWCGGGGMRRSWLS